MTRWALVTGAAGDLGRAIGRALGEDGWSLMLTDHPSAAAGLAASAQECRAVVPGVVTSLFDVTDEDAVGQALRGLVAAHGVPTAVVANAGVQGVFAPLHAYDIACLRSVLDVNVVGVFTVVKAAALALEAAKLPGAMVLTASMAGVGGAPNMAAYSASKAAVIGLAKSAAKDLAPLGIRVNAVSPGFIGPGAMWDKQTAGQAAVGSQYYATDPSAVASQMLGMIPLRRCGTPAEVADVVAYLVGERSSYLTGLNIEISGASA